MHEIVTILIGDAAAADETQFFECEEDDIIETLNREAITLGK